MSRAPNATTFDVDAFASAILATIEQRQIRHEDMAEQAGVYADLLGRMRAIGRRPSVDAFLSMCAWAGLNPMDFYIPPKPATARPASSVFHLGTQARTP